ncbi:MAG: hypothetical protein EXR95_03525 [Gemmatimonadetes bacterium]|nr:hypothetical protein [Gemmatimonadota bacterium]
MNAQRLRPYLMTLLTLAAAPLAAQSASAELTRVAGCYAIEPAADAPWLHDLEPRLRLTLEPAETELGAEIQYLVRPAGERTMPAKYPFLAWSLLGDGALVSIVWSSDKDMVGLSFAPEPERAHARTIGSTTFFSHEMMRTTPPVDVRVTAIDC